MYKRRDREMRYMTVIAEMILVVTVRGYDEQSTVREMAGVNP